MPAEPDREARRAFIDGPDGYASERQWYSKRASELKSRAQRSDIAIIVAGAFVAALPAAGGPQWMVFIVSALGIAIIVLKGTARVLRDGEVWPEYRLASEMMKREARFYVNVAGAYDTDDETARKRYVLATEAIIAGEQAKFFQGLAEDDKTEGTAKTAKSGSPATEPDDPKKKGLQ
ncbi:MAG: DUF4231 domain-containing protein [Pseudomonadota bacterium]